jgi:gluconate 5-dehydrogenase
VNSTPYLHRLFALDDLVAVVTGGNSGIGRSIAAALARAGAAVVLVARDRDRLTSTVEELRADGCRAESVSADIATRAAVRAAADDAAAIFGEPDILVNCAGVNLRPPLPDLDERDWDTTMAVNLAAPFLLGQRFAPGMAERGFGRIVSVSSQQAHRAFAQSGAYGVSKGGLESLVRSQAEAWSARGVTSNALVPGFIPTAMNARLASDPVQLAALAARTFVGRNGVPDDFAGAAVFLASRASAYITGQAIAVDGGFSVH